jgi:hypothetical protein
MARGHCPIFGCLHKPSMIIRWPFPEPADTLIFNNAFA